MSTTVVPGLDSFEDSGALVTLGLRGYEIYRKIVRLSSRCRNVRRQRYIEQALLGPPMNDLSPGERAYLIRRYLAKWPDWPEGQAHLFCEAL